MGNGMTSWEKVMQVVMPRLAERFPNGLVPRPALMEELAHAGLPKNQPKLTAGTQESRGIYNLQQFFPNRDTESEVSPKLSDEEIVKQTNENFRALNRIGVGIVSGHFRSAIISGPPGIGKTYELNRLFTEALKDQKITKYSHERGTARATGVYRKLYEHRNQKDVLMLDDCDAVFFDENSLNLLKAACDSSDVRTLSWLSEKSFETEEGEEEDEIPRKFDFEGHVVFVTNLDFDTLMLGNSRLTPHLQALVSRALYLDMNLRTAHELMLRVRYVAEHTEQLKGHTKEERKRILDYMERNVSRLREISCRTAWKLSLITKAATSNEDFEATANASLLRRKG